MKGQPTSVRCLGAVKLNTPFFFLRHLSQPHVENGRARRCALRSVWHTHKHCNIFIKDLFQELLQLCDVDVSCQSGHDNALDVGHCGGSKWFLA